jgi:hypothetical protein
VRHVERLPREDQGPTTSDSVARHRRYCSMNSSESGCPLSSSIAWASDMGTGTSSSTLRAGLYHCIVSVIGPLLLGWELRLSPTLVLERTEHRKVLRASLRGAEPGPRVGDGVTLTSKKVSYWLPPVAITHLQRLSTGFPLPPPGAISCFQDARGLPLTSAEPPVR